MNKQQYKEFEKLWKVKLLIDLKKINEESGFKSTVTRDENHSIERDLRMIRYGFEGGLKFRGKEE